MPYRLSTKIRDKKKVWCMTAIETNKTYCYPSKEARSRGIIMHQRYAHEKGEKK